MVTQLKKAALLALTISLTASPGVAQASWLTSLKIFAAPLTHYPRLTAAFTALTVTCAASMQYAFKQYKAAKVVTEKVARLRSENEKLATEKPNEELRTMNEELRPMKEQLVQAKQKENASLLAIATAQLKIESLSQEHPKTVAPSHVSAAPTMASEIARLNHERDRLKIYLKTQDETLHTMEHNEQARQYAALALCIKNKPKIDVDNVLAHARYLMEIDPESIQEMKDLKKDDMAIREQLESILERWRENPYDYFHTKYTNQMQEMHNPDPRELYSNMGIMATEGMLCDVKALKPYITTRPLRHIFYGAALTLNPLAKENYDAFLQGKQALNNLAPTPKQYYDAQLLYDQLRNKLCKNHDQLDQHKGKRQW